MAASKSSSLEKAFLDFQSKVAAVVKGGRNPHYKSAYAKYEDVVAHVGGPLHEAGLSFRHTSLVTEHGWYVGTKLIHAESGSESEIFQMLCPIGKMQEMGSAVTYAKRYTLMAILGLPSEDDDGNVASKIVAPPAKPKIENYTATNPQKTTLKEWAAAKGITDRDMLLQISQSWMNQPMTKDVFDSITEEL